MLSEHERQKLRELLAGSGMLSLGAVVQDKEARMEAKPKKYWIGDVSKTDDFGDPIKEVFIDGATVHGPWAVMTPASHDYYGRGLGTGRGQKYMKQADGKWLKVEG